MQFVSTENHAQTFLGIVSREEGGVYVAVSGPVFKSLLAIEVFYPTVVFSAIQVFCLTALTSAVYSARVKTGDLILSRRTGKTDEIDPRVGSLTGSL